MSAVSDHAGIWATSTPFWEYAAALTANLSRQGE